MSIAKGLRTAALLDRLSTALGLPSDVQDDHDPLSQLIAEGDRRLQSLCAEMAADEIIKARQRAQEMENRYPGYAEELKRQRARLGLPPV